VQEEAPEIAEHAAIDQIPGLATEDAAPEILIGEPAPSQEKVGEPFQAEETVLDQAYVLRHELPPEPAMESPAEASAVEGSLVLDEPEAIAAPTVVSEPQVLNTAGVAEHAGAQAEHAPAQPRAIPNASEIMAAEAGMLVDDCASFAGDEEILDSIVALPEQPTRQPDAAEPAEQEPRADATINVPEVKGYDDFDIAWEVERLLRNRRWREKGDEPFSGFKSPPGRF
jgi:hypothetical protein